MALSSEQSSTRCVSYLSNKQATSSLTKCRASSIQRFATKPCQWRSSSSSKSAFSPSTSERKSDSQRWRQQHTHRTVFFHWPKTHGVSLLLLLLVWPGAWIGSSTGLGRQLQRWSGGHYKVGFRLPGYASFLNYTANISFPIQKARTLMLMPMGQRYIGLTAISREITQWPSIWMLLPW